MNRTFPICLLALTLSVTMLPQRHVSALERLSPEELLERVRQAREPESPLTRRIEYAIVADYADHPEEQERLQMTIDAYLDITKASRRTTSRRWTGEDSVEPPRKQFNQSLWDGERYYSVGKWYPEPGVPLWGGGTGTDGHYVAPLRSVHIGSELGGVLYSDHEPYYKVLEDAKKIKVRIDKETFGAATYRVEATTERGFYQLWIDPEQDYHIRRAIIEKSGEDLGWNDIAISEYEWLPRESIRYTLTNEKFDTVNGRIFPMEGHTVVETVFLNGGPGGSASSESVTEIRITSMELNPDFDALAAFTLDAPPMTLLTDWGNDNESVVWTGSGLSNDESLVEEAKWTSQTTLRAAIEPRPKIFDEEADGRVQIRQAIEQAKAEGKRTLISWGSNWCGWCHELEGVCQTDPEVNAFIEAHYVPVLIDLGDRDKHMDLALEYGLDFNELRTAHVTILDENGEVVAQRQPAGLIGLGKGGGFTFNSKKLLDFLARYGPEH